MYALGTRTTVYVDDYLPMHDGELLLAKLGKDKSAWAAIVEKAFAKRYGNYQHIIGGWMATGVSQLNGSPYVTHLHNEIENDALWDKLVEADEQNNIITCGTDCSGGGAYGDEDCMSRDNLVGGHAYTTIGVTTI